MTSIVIGVLVSLLVAAAVVLYVAYPRRGEAVPHTPWLGTALRRTVHRLPTLDNQRDRREG